MSEPASNSSRDPQLSSTFSYHYVLLVGTFLKLLVSVVFPNLSRFLDSSAEFSTPVTSWRSVEEGVFLLNHNIDPYDGGVVYHPPLLLVFFAFIKKSTNTEETYKVITNLIFQSVDLLIAFLLVQVSERFLAANKVSKPTKSRCLILLSLFYSFNPINFLSALSNSTIIFTNFFLIITIYAVTVLDSIPVASVALAVSGYLSYNTVFLLVPFIALSVNFYKFSSESSKSSPQTYSTGILKAFVPFVVTLSTLIYSSYSVNGHNWNFLSATYGTNIFFTKINPNLGLWWYFFIEIFEFFSKFFVGVFNIYNFVYVIPITVRFFNSKYSNLTIHNKYRLFPLILCYGSVVLTKAYPTLNDFVFITQLLLLLVFQSNFAILKFLRYPIVSALLIIHAVILSPIFYYLWIFSGSGNSNFFYAINLVYALGLGSTLIDFIWSYLSLEFLFEKNNGKEVDSNVTVRLTQI